MWQDQIFMQHIAIKGLATAGGIPGTIVDACLMILKHHDTAPVMKWVDDFHIPLVSHHVAFEYYETYLCI